MNSVGLLEQPRGRIDWRPVFYDEKYSAFPAMDKTEEGIQRSAQPYIKVAEGDRNFQQTFSTLPLSVAVALLADEAANFKLINYSLEKDPNVLVELANNPTVALIKGEEELRRGLRLKINDISSIDFEHVHRYGQSLWIGDVVGIIEDAPVGVDCDKVLEGIAESCMQGLVIAYARDYAANESIKLPRSFYNLAANPRFATDLYQTVLQTPDPLEGIGKVVSTAVKEKQPNYTRAYQRMREALASYPYFAEPVHASLRPFFGDTQISATLHRFGSIVLGGKGGDKETEELDKAGISARGTEGIRQLRYRYAMIARQIIETASHTTVSELVADSPLDTEFVKATIKWARFDWGIGSEEKFQELVSELERVPESLLTSRHARSDFTPIALSEKPLQKPTEDMLRRLDLLWKAHARANTDRFEAFNRGVLSGDQKADFVLAQSKTIEAIQQKIDIMIENAVSNRTKAPSEKQQAVEFQISKLEAIRNYDFSRFPDGISDLAKYKKTLAFELTTLLFDMQRMPGEAYFEWMNGSGKDALGKVIENIDHSVTESLLQRYPDLHDADRKAMLDLLNTRAFGPLFLGKKSKRNTEVQFVPVRGLLLEASGHIASACWAEKYNITVDNPNIDGLLFVERSKQNRGELKLTGACLLIHTTDLEGQPILIVRGLNPAQSFIDRVDVENFYDSLAAYAKQIATKDRRKAAIVIDNKVGRAASNRSLMYAYLRRQKQGLSQAKITADNTTFNQYDITRDTYYLP